MKLWIIETTPALEEKKQEKRKGERKSHQSKTYLLMEAENIRP